MPELKNIDLRNDPNAARYVKNELVLVAFAGATGELISREGLNRFQTGDALITGSTGDRWCVSRDRFDAKYEAVPPLSHGADGRYRNRPIPVLAKQMRTAFSIARCENGDLLLGLTQDWLLQYGPGDFGIVENARFQKVYRAV